MIHPISHRFQVTAYYYSQILAFDWGVPLFIALFLCNMWEYHHKSYIAETEFCFADSISLNFNHLDVTGPKFKLRKSVK